MARFLAGSRAFFCAFVIASEAKQSSGTRHSGLLRFARNDDGGWTPQRPFITRPMASRTSRSP